jgi:hypothetical protein
LHTTQARFRFSGRATGHLAAADWLATPRIAGSRRCVCGCREPDSRSACNRCSAFEPFARPSPGVS